MSLDFIQNFGRPLLLGETVQLDLPLDDDDFAEIIADPTVHPSLQSRVMIQMHTIWAGCPSIPANGHVFAVCSLIHDLLVGLHPSSGWSAPSMSYLDRLADRVIERSQRLPNDPAWLLVRWVVAEAGLKLMRHDTFIKFHFLGELEGFGERPSYLKLPWRRVESRSETTVQALDVFTIHHWDMLAEISPLSAAIRAMEQGTALPLPSLEPILQSTPLCRWFARMIRESSHGIDALIAALQSGRSFKPMVLRQWLGLVLYIATDIGLGQPSEWYQLLNSLAPYARVLGAERYSKNGHGVRWQRVLLQQAELTPQMREQ